MDSFKRFYQFSFHVFAQTGPSSSHPESQNILQLVKKGSVSFLIIFRNPLIRPIIFADFLLIY